MQQTRLLSCRRFPQNRRELVQQLIAAKALRRLFELWRTDKTVKPPVILNGGFEQPISAWAVIRDRLVYLSEA